MKLLPISARNQRCQHRHGLAVVSGQEPSHQIVAQGLASRQPEEIIEIRTEDVDSVGGSDGGLARSRHRWCPESEWHDHERGLFQIASPRPTSDWATVGAPVCELGPLFREDSFYVSTLQPRGRPRRADIPLLPARVLIPEVHHSQASDTMARQ